MATLNDYELAIIIYCAQQGVSKSLLGRRFRKSRFWMHRLTQRDLYTVFPDDSSAIWFESGVRAQQLVDDFQQSVFKPATEHVPPAGSSEPTRTPLAELAMHKRREKEERDAQRIKNLLQYLNVDRSTEEEEEEEDRWFS